MKLVGGVVIKVVGWVGERFKSKRSINSLWLLLLKHKMKIEYTLKFSRGFDKTFSKLDNSIKKEAHKKILKLKEFPKEVGKPLKFFKNLFELHVQMYGIFYVVENYQVNVLILDMIHKNETDKYLKKLNEETIMQLLSDVY